MLSAEEARVVWERIERSPCRARMGSDERHWIELMKAVGKRAAPEMARLAEALLAKPSDLPAGTASTCSRPHGRPHRLAECAEAAALWTATPEAITRGLRLSTPTRR
jgi:hypothetical protein